MKEILGAEWNIIQGKRKRDHIEEKEEEKMEENKLGRKRDYSRNEVNKRNEQVEGDVL